MGQTAYSLAVQQMGEIIEKANLNQQAVDAALGPINEQLADITINVRSYGAVGNDTTDDNPAFIAAAQALATAGGGTLLIPPSQGSYYLSSDNSVVIPSNCRVLCAGRITFPKTRTKSVFTLSNVANVTIDTLQVDGGALDDDVYSDTCHVLEIRSCRNVEVNRPLISNVLGDGVYIGRLFSLGVVHSEDINVIGGFYHNTKRNAVAITDGRNITISRVTVTSNKTGIWNRSHPLDIEPNNTDDHLVNIEVSNNYLDCITGTGSVSGGIRCAIGAGKQPSEFHSIRIIDNIINLGTGSPAVVMEMEGGDTLSFATDIYVMRNKIIGGACVRGIQVYRCTGHVVIQDNEVSESTGAGIYYVQNLSTDGHIERNKINISAGRGIHALNFESDSKLLYVQRNKVTGSTTANETIMVDGTNILAEAIVTENICEATGSTNGLRVFNAVNAMVEKNNSDKVTTSSNTAVRRADNTINGVFPVGSAAPSTGTWTRGDIVYNSAPSAAGYTGWICVSAGTPGTWKGFGLIES